MRRGGALGPPSAVVGVTPQAVGGPTALPEICCEKPHLLPNVRPDTVVNPRIIFEILSSSTERWDRGAKLAHYRRLGSLREVILIVQDEIRIEHYVRQADDRWLLHGDWIGAESGPLALVNPAVILPLRDVYDGVEGL